MPEKMEVPRLDAEIAVLRELIQRVGEMAEEDRSLKEMLQILQGISRSSHHLALLLKASQQMAAASAAEAEAAEAQSGAELTRAWQEAIRELTRGC